MSEKKITIRLETKVVCHDLYGWRDLLHLR